MSTEPERFRFVTRLGHAVEADTARALRKAVDSQKLDMRDALVGYESDGPGLNALDQVNAAFPPSTGLRWFSHRRWGDKGMVPV